MSNTSEILRAHLPCPCGKSSDAYAERLDGTAFCFSCSRNFPSVLDSGGIGDAKAQEVQSGQEESGFAEHESIQLLPIRGHSKRAEGFYKVRSVIDSSGEVSKRIYPYPSEWSKIRSVRDKQFYTQGNSCPELFGQQLFSLGSHRVITICEGEEDVLSVFEILGTKYPVVSVRNASTAKSDCAAQREYLNSFDKIVLCLDNDEAGRRAAAGIAGLFDFNKVFHCKLSKYKDANDYEINGCQDEFRNIWYNAGRFLPEDIVSRWEDFSKIIRSEQKAAIGSYPIKSLQDMSYGFRGGEVVLITALEGIGKTEIIRLFEWHLLKTTDHNIACIHLEESQNRQLRGLAGYELGLPCHFPETPVSPEEIDNAIHNLTGRDDRLHLYGHFGSDDPDLILDKIRFLVAAANCRFVFLDHISMVVSGLNLDDERKVLDYLSTKFATMVHDLDFCFVMVSHVNDEEKTRGSRNISKVSDLHVHLSRDITAASAAERNVTDLIIKKNRFGAQTGPAGRLYFDPYSFMLTEINPEMELPPV